MTSHDIEYVKRCIAEDIHRFYIWTKWKHKRREILEMDHNECQTCKAKGRYTKANTVHHVKFLDKHPELALETWYEFGGKRYRNLISVCHDCHEELHGHRQKKEKKPLTEERW